MGRGVRYIWPDGHEAKSRQVRLIKGFAVYNPFANEVGRIIGLHPAGKGKVWMVDFVEVKTGRRSTGNIGLEMLVPCPLELERYLPPEVP